MDIIDIIGDFISLKRSGQNYKALSPFTNEKTASFYVVPSKGIFKDFSSGKGGDGITFVMEHEGMSYMEAIRYLGRKYGVDLKEDAPTPESISAQTSKDSLYILMNYAKDYYRKLLTENEEGRSVGLTYFRERGFNDRTIEKFELGYSINSWDHLTRKALQDGHTEDMLEKAGLLIRKEEGKRYDRFRGRVIFPVHNISGKVIAFGARLLTKEKDQPKYLNSPETEIYHKSNVLYGLYQAKNAIRREDFCYLVEGYTDVISLHQSEIDNVVASSGTALTEEQIKLVKRFSENITVMYDGDTAGIKAAVRGIDLVLKAGLNVRIVLLPDGEDPDSFSRKMGSAELKQYLKAHTKDFISFKIDLYAAESANDPIRKAEAIREIVTSIAFIPDPIKRSVYLQETGQLLKIQESVLITELNKIIINERKKNKEPERPARGETKEGVEVVEEIPLPTTRLDSAGMVQLQERESIRLLLNYAENSYEDRRLVDYLMVELEDVEFTNPVYKAIYETFREGAVKGDVVDTFHFMEKSPETVRNTVAELTTHRYETSKHWSDKYHIHFPHEREILNDLAFSNVLRLKFRMVTKLIEENLLQLKQATNEEDQEKYFTIHEQLKAAEKDLASLLGIVVPR